jgi:hypothetical protein
VKNPSRSPSGTTYSERSRKKDAIGIASEMSRLGLMYRAALPLKQHTRNDTNAKRGNMQAMRIILSRISH